jgi:hypothetical protein
LPFLVRRIRRGRRGRRRFPLLEFKAEKRGDRIRRENKVRLVSDGIAGNKEFKVFQWRFKITDNAASPR